MDLLELICSKDIDLNSPPSNVEEMEQTEQTPSNLKPEYLLGEQMSNLGGLLVQNVFLDSSFIDYQWPVSLNDSEDNFEAEVEAIKLFIER
jgi:hypothetical protein